VVAGRARPSSAVQGPSSPVSAGGRDPLSTRAQNSPTLLVNPVDRSNLVVVSRVDSQPLTCGVDISLDGGATWEPKVAPTVPGKSTACFAPDAAFSPDGTLAVSFTTWAPVPGAGVVPDGVWVATSRDGGRTLSTPVLASGAPGALQVRLAADPSSPGRLYAAWLHAAGIGSWGLTDVGNPIVVARSDDGGATWSPPVNVSAPNRQRVVAPSIAVGWNGRVHVTYVDVGDDVLDYHGAHEGRGGPPYDGPWTVVAAGSADVGVTWSESTVGIVLGADRFLTLYPPTPALAVGPDGNGERLHVAFSDGRSGSAEVLVWSSSDGGRTWRVPRPVDPGATGSQLLPGLDAGPDGRLDVVYYVRPDAEPGPGTTVVLQSSFDEGATWTRPERLSDAAFDSSIGQGSQRGLPSMGSRLAVLSTGTGALAVWTDTRGGTPATGKQDLARAVVRFSSPAWVGPARQGGVGVALAGVILGAGAIRGRRRRSAATNRGHNGTNGDGEAPEGP